MAKCIGCSTQGGLLSGVFRAAQRPTGAPGGLAAAWSPVEMVRLQPEPRSARRAAVPSAGCVRRAAADGQAAHGWPGQHRPIRQLAARRASSCRMTSPWPATAALWFTCNWPLSLQACNYSCNYCNYNRPLPVTCNWSGQALRPRAFPRGHARCGEAISSSRTRHRGDGSDGSEMRATRRKLAMMAQRVRRDL